MDDGFAGSKPGGFMNYRNKLVLIALSIVFVSYAVIGGFLNRVKASEDSYSQLSVFNEVLAKIRSSYVEDPNIALVMNGALRGLLESLDPYSTYLSPEEYARYKKNKNNGEAGVGLELSKEPQLGLIYVIHAIAGAPADQLGIKSGDYIESIEDVSTRDISLIQADYMLSGDTGSSVKLKLLRRGKAEPLQFSIERQIVKIPPVKSQLMENNKVGYLRVYRFVSGTGQDLQNKLQQLMKSGVQKVVLDLRNCGGENFDEGVHAANLFLDHGVIAYIQGQKYPKKEFVADPQKSICKLPLALLENNGTAGAAEILASAIKENRRGSLVGVHSFGKASVQKLLPLEGDSAILISVAKFYSQSGQIIQKNGIAPDQEVRNSSDSLTGDIEDEDESVDEKQAPAVPASQEDLQLKKAIELLDNPERLPKAA
jgi:carboxyl-terminal processing protease